MRIRGLDTKIAHARFSCATLSYRAILQIEITTPL